MSLQESANNPWKKTNELTPEKNLILAIIAQSVSDMSTGYNPKNLKPNKYVNKKGEVVYYQKEQQDDKATARNFIESDLFEKSCDFIGIRNYVRPIREKVLSPEFSVNPQHIKSCIALGD